MGNFSRRFAAWRNRAGHAFWLGWYSAHDRAAELEAARAHSLRSVLDGHTR
jgi:hypothetical protein